MRDGPRQSWKYDAESDVLDVYFGERRPAWTIELTENVNISIDREAGVPVALSFLDYSALIETTPFGPRSFPVTGLAELPIPERDLVLGIITTEPVSGWLDVSTVEKLPDSPFAVAHVERPPKEVLNALNAPAPA